jgi:hypothetical protein
VACCQNKLGKIVEQQIAAKPELVQITTAYVFGNSNARAGTAQVAILYGVHREANDSTRAEIDLTTNTQHDKFARCSK